MTDKMLVQASVEPDPVLGFVVRIQNGNRTTTFAVESIERALRIAATACYGWADDLALHAGGLEWQPSGRDGEDGAS